ncbi:uncharacterized protein LOC114789062 isoform X4 [Denticeps clupeoides]|uniref:uncharacterized protein LOC114789062 isoform X4 n=1 Tax=Denticeps clupeoides TaxID=299321 RepID=UPI0010A47F9E|nr:uncharacterized protein LOC114789062 isoform X4 [Denticeps clupeoides]
MSETLIVTFQSQLAGIMETILKSAVYEITRLVEDNFLQEVDRGKQEVEMLRLKLQLSEIKLKEKEWERRKRVRCVDCGRAGVVEGEETCNSQQIDADILGNNEEKESMDKEWCSTLKQENKNAEDPVCARDQASKLNHNIGVSCTFASKRTLQSPTLTGSAPSLNDGSHFQQCGSDADELSSSPAAPSTRQVSCITSGSISDSRCPVTYPDVPSESTAIACHVKEEAEATPVWSSKHIETDFRHDWPPERGSRGPSENSDSQIQNAIRYPIAVPNKRRTKITLKTFSHVARQILIQSQVWQKACYSRTIDWRPITEKIISALPQLSGRETEVIVRCTKMLHNRRDYLRRRGLICGNMPIISKQISS